ncbi:hypothetical protein NQ314_009674, partial [Rhamnusium bicolor]
QISNKSNGNYKRNKLGIFGIKIIIGTTVVGYLGYHLYDRQRNFVSTQIEKVSSTRKNSVGEFKKGLPSYPLSEISKHNSMGSRVWVTYKEGVYDITEYVAAHPGGDQILMAGGSSLEPFWLIYSLHHNEHVYEILEEHRIGVIFVKKKRIKREREQERRRQIREDPVRRERKKEQSRQKYLRQKREGLQYKKSISQLTPREQHKKRKEWKINSKNYRNRIKATLMERRQIEEGTPPPSDDDNFVPQSRRKLEIRKAVGRRASERNKVRHHRVKKGLEKKIAAFQIRTGTYVLVTIPKEKYKKLNKNQYRYAVICQSDLDDDGEVKPLQGVMWGLSAIGNAKWTGVRLRDILKIAGINEDEEIYKHVHFVGLDFDVAGTNYSGSIPIWRALEKRCDVLLVYEMNGVPLSRDHGFPLRLLQPGCAGCRNVKWIGKIIVSEKENDSHWQQNDYKGVSPSADFDNVDFSKSPAIQELPLTSAICQPAENDTVDVIDGHIFIKGYAWSGNGQKIVRVDVTADGGKTWYIADLYLQDTALPPQHWSWTLWSINIPVGKNLENVEIWAKAVDNCYNTQPESFQNIYNFRGVLNNAYHRVKVNLNY